MLKGLTWIQRKACLCWNFHWALDNMPSVVTRFCSFSDVRGSLWCACACGCVCVFVCGYTLCAHTWFEYLTHKHPYTNTSIHTHSHTHTLTHNVNLRHIHTTSSHRLPSSLSLLAVLTQPAKVAAPLPLRVTQPALLLVLVTSNMRCVYVRKLVCVCVCVCTCECVCIYVCARICEWGQV